ncbi:putative uncharacterized protein [Prevotella sp. CAG:732]|nr:putative uncharacterized protein [Prevotella sp. CAG:732]
MDKHIFNEEQLKRAEDILANPLAKLSSLSSSELRDLAVVWCYYSGKIEGNTYTYVETETLLKDGITPEKRYEDAKMLKSVVMMNADLIPVYSAKDADILHYRRGLIAFYETGDYTQYADYFLGRLKERLEEIE